MRLPGPRASRPRSRDNGMFVMIALLVLFPGLALWLPERFY